MCRNVNVTLLPVRIEELLYTRDPQSGKRVSRSRDDVLSDLRARRERIQTIAEDCTKKSTRAGYDAGGMAVGVIDLGASLQHVESDDAPGGPPAGLSTKVRSARGGGDLLHTWNSLVDRL